ncbi:unnamed protein product, partial [marine sediment metagenome]
KITDGVYQQERWPSFKGLFASGDVNTYTTQSIIKVLSREYTKGVVQDDGTVLPFVLDGLP